MCPIEKSEPEPLSPSQVRDELIDAVERNSSDKLRALCKEYRSYVAEHVDAICELPEGLSADDDPVQTYGLARLVEDLATAARCLAEECGAPELWKKLREKADENTLIEWMLWLWELPARKYHLEYEALISEAITFVENAMSLRGGAARLYEAFFHGHLGDLLFHCGRAAEAIEPFRAALELCVESNDIEGRFTYLRNLLEVHRYLDDGLAVQAAERILELRASTGFRTDDVERQIERLRGGEPLCRVVCVRNGRELELDEITEVATGGYQFRFRRNRRSLHKTGVLTRQGNRLAQSGKYSDALEKYREASEVDPYDPDPVYQSGMCLLESGAYAKAREAFEEVERRAPGWFRCRTDRWLAEGLEGGVISKDEFRVLRVLEDGGLDAARAYAIAEQAIERFPDFAPFHLVFGDLCRNRGDLGGAVAAYRRGLELVEEPDLESRLLCALAGTLPADSPERAELIQRALRLEGSLVALATVRLLALQ